jgi:hypothetical protein
MRTALERFMQSMESGSKQKKKQMPDRLRIPPEAPPTVVEKLLLDRAASEILRRFVYEHQTHKQHVVRMALIDYLDALDRTK